MSVPVMDAPASKSKKSWGELTRPRRVGLTILAVIQLTLLAAALLDIALRSPEEVQGDRRVWAGVAFINWVGPLAYFVFGRRRGPDRSGGLSVQSPEARALRTPARA